MEEYYKESDRFTSKTYQNTSKFTNKFTRTSVNLLVKLTRILVMLANPPKGGCHGGPPGVLGPVVAWQPGVQGSRPMGLV